MHFKVAILSCQHKDNPLTGGFHLCCHKGHETVERIFCISTSSYFDTLIRSLHYGLLLLYAYIMLCKAISAYSIQAAVIVTLYIHTNVSFCIMILLFVSLYRSCEAFA